jgi:hypothetical protein
MIMSLSSIQSTNVAALLNKAYSTDSSAAASSASSTAVATDKETTPSSSTDSPSTEVTLGGSATSSGTYTAQGLLQQMRQFQLSSTSLLYGDGDSSDDDSTGLLGMVSTTQSSDLETSSQNWVDEISANPEKAAVMVQNSKNDSISTILSGQS